MAAYLRTIDTDEGRNDGKTRTHYADDLERCGRWLEFESYAHREASLLVSAYFCDRYRLCPFCAMRRCARSLQDNAPKIRHALTETVEHTPDAYLGLLTLTVKNGPDLAERFAHLMDSWRTMIRRRRHYLEWKNGRGRPRKWSFGAAFSGGAYSVEIKRGCGTRGGNWHPHLHAAVLVTEPVTRQQISDEWKEITDDSHIVDLRPFHSFQESTNPTDEDIASDLIEVLKYPLKFETVSLSDNWHAELVLAGKRLRDTFGSFRGVKLEPAELTDYAEDFAGEPFVRIAAEWIDDRYIVREGLRYEG